MGASPNFLGPKILIIKFRKRDKPEPPSKQEANEKEEIFEKIEKKFKIEIEEPPKQKDVPKPTFTQETPPELLEQFKKLEEEISKIKTSEPENQNPSNQATLEAEEKLKEEGELDIKKNEKFPEEEIKNEEALKKKISQSNEKKKKIKKKEKKSHKKKDKKTHKRKDKRSRSRSKSQKNRKSHDSDSSEED